MNLIYYPDMYVTADELLKGLILCWGKVSTVIPPSQMDYTKAYLEGQIQSETSCALEMYKKVNGTFGESVLDFVVISDEERIRASEKMLDVLAAWNKDTHFFDSLRIHSVSDLVGKTVEWYWFLHEKLEQPLVEMLLEERLVVNWEPGEIVGFQEVGKSYMSIIADEVRQTRNARMVTDDEFLLAAKSGTAVQKVIAQHPEDQYQLVSLAIPQVFIDKETLCQLTWLEVKRIREDLLPYAEGYYSEVEGYQKRINDLTAAGKDADAFDKFAEFCERVAASFRPLAKEAGKLFRLASDTKTLGMLNGVLLPTIRLVSQDPFVARICDIASISSASASYCVSNKTPTNGFEYLANLSRELTMRRMKSMLSCLVPKGLR